MATRRIACTIELETRWKLEPSHPFAEHGIPEDMSFRSKNERKLITTRTGAYTESFRALRSAIGLGQAAGSQILTILVTSANPSEGKSTVAAHLTVAFARSGPPSW